MIGKMMSDSLLDGKMLEFYQWLNLNAIKKDVKGKIDELAATWSEEERSACVKETPSTFKNGGALLTPLRS